MHKITRSFMILLALGATVFSYAQPGTSSPYSLSGLGEMKYGGFINHQMMGGVSRAYRHETSYTPVNPASYSAINATVFDAGANVTSGTLKTDLQTADVFNGNFGYFSMAFSSPYKKKLPWGISMGIRQMSDVGYEIKAFNHDTFASYNIFKGTGGLSTAYLGGAIEPMAGLSVGLNMNYNFGNIRSVQAQIFPDTKDLFSFSDETYVYYRGFNFDIGVQYYIQAGGFGHTLGATYHTASNLKGRGYRYSETFFGGLFDQGQLEHIDTIIFEDDLKRSAVKPGMFGVAYSLSRADVWTLGVEYERAMWSGQVNEVNGESYNDNEKFAVGVSVVPRPDYQSTRGYFGKVNYSAGLRYENLYYNFFGQQLNEVGISFGLGLPIVKTFQSREGKVPMVNRLNLGFEFMRRGTTDNDLIQEDYFTVSIGLNFNDKWFLKRKYQ